MIPLSHVLLLSGILFSLAVAGIFINRKNVLLLLMCIELMLLAVNFNFIAFAHHLGDLAGQAHLGRSRNEQGNTREQDKAYHETRLHGPAWASTLA